ncbi:MAG: DUF368 domain-containing protein [Bdellovibrionales bacterium]|nr:DUF368 domain-containing protein [Bdellovibrionales bacterium]
MEKLTWKEAFWGGPGPSRKRDLITLYLKGFLMGIADLIPGVSGGTIAFITGIYEDLLNAIATVNKEVIFKILKFQWKTAAHEMHLKILLPILGGILTAIFSLAKLMHFLLNNHPIPTWGLFFGLITASIIIVGKDLDKTHRIHSPTNILWIIIGVVVGYGLVSLIPVHTPENLFFIFLCGVIGITAMILPGISGSFILLILGKYEFITASVKDPFHGNNIITLLVFGCGSVTGLLGFSKILNYLLKHFRKNTLAFLVGLLIGTLKKLWPWKEVLESTVIRGKTRVLREQNFFPADMSFDTLFVFGIMLVGFLAIIFMEYASNHKRTSS